VFFPVLVCRLTENQGVPDNGSYTFPVRTDCRINIESVILQPSPILSTKVSYNPGWYEAAKMFAYKTDIYPSVVSGHSFARLGLDFITDIALATGHPSLLALAGAGTIIERTVDNYGRYRKKRGPPPRYSFPNVTLPNKGYTKGYKNQRFFINGKSFKQKPKNKLTITNPAMKNINKNMANSNNMNLNKANTVPPEIKMSAGNARSNSQKPQWKRKGRSKSRSFRS